MGKNIKATRNYQCNGCELCVAESQRQNGKNGLEGALIRILRSSDPNSEYPVYSIDIDPRIESQDVEKIRDICPRDVFDVSQT